LVSKSLAAKFTHTQSAEKRGIAGLNPRPSISNVCNLLPSEMTLHDVVLDIYSDKQMPVPIAGK